MECVDKVSFYIMIPLLKYLYSNQIMVKKREWEKHAKKLVVKISSEVGVIYSR